MTPGRFFFSVPPLMLVIASIACERHVRLADTPEQIAAKNSANGCWVQIWEDENFQDDNDVITGPGKWNNMRKLPGANKSDWGDEIDSIRMGSKATGKFWEDEEFKDNSITINPGEERTNLRGSPDMGDTIDSMEITCT
jgi:hypothetical protein